MRKQILLLAILIFTLSGCTQADHINSLIQKLADKNAAVSQAAADELVIIGVPAVKPLVALLNSKDSGIRNAASDTLSKIGLLAIDPLIATLNDKDYDTRQAASEALVKIDGPAVEKLIAQVDSPNDGIRYHVIETLGKIKDGRSVEPLIRHLKDPSAIVKTAAAKALVSIGLSATERLINAIRDPDADFKLSVISILGDVGDVRSITVLIDNLANDNVTISQGATLAILKIGSPAIEPLLNSLSNLSPDTQCRIYYALWEIHYAPSIDGLIHVKAVAAKAETLKKIGTPAIEQLIAHVMKDNSYRLWILPIIRDIICSAPYEFDIKGTGIEDILFWDLNWADSYALAERYVNYPDGLLKRAAYHWAYSHGFKVETITYPRLPWNIPR